MTRQQVTLISIFTLFLAPVLLVLLMRSSWWEYQPKGLRNHGQLVEPPVALPAGSLAQEGKWLLLYVMPENCDRHCTDDIVTLRQVHRAAGRQGEHLAIIILDEHEASYTLQSKIESISEEFSLITDPSTEIMAALASINASFAREKGVLNDIRTYVADPMLNVILAYQANANPSNINKDLKHLLKWSKQDTVE